MLGALKMAPALCAGNTIVLKAAEDAPLGILFISKICQKFLPKVLLNILTGTGPECGAPIAQSKKLTNFHLLAQLKLEKL